VAPKDQPTIGDVARIAGVSIATVSRAVHFPERVADTTRKKVNQAILVTGYTTNAMARSLRVGRSNAILVLAPDIGDPNFATTLIGIETEARTHGFAILIGHTQNDPERALDYLRYVTSHQAAGMILFTGRLPAGDAVSSMPLPPIVAAFEPIEDSPYPYVGVDDFAGARKATEHLLAAGHREIAFVGETKMQISYRRRRAGFDAAMEAAKLPRVAPLILEGDGTISAGYQAVELCFMRDRLPTAFMCVNDYTAIGVMNALTARGYNIPLDFSVTGFDDVPQATYVTPALTTIRQPRSIIGKLAITKLIQMIADRPKTEAPAETLILPELVLRGSVTSRKYPA